MQNKTLLRFAAVCSLLTVLTTFGLYFLFESPTGFDEKLLLYKHSVHNFRLWVVIFHCIFITITMYAIALILFKNNPGYAGLGFISILVFAIMEITRAFGVLLYINPLRQKYLESTSEISRQLIQNSFENWDLICSLMFGVFILGFAFNKLCYGLAIIKGEGIDRWMGIIFLLWAAIGFNGLYLEFSYAEWRYQIMNYTSYTFQPAARLFIAYWLFMQTSPKRVATFA